MTPQKDLEHISTLIVKFLKDEISDTEQQALDSWLAESQENRDLLESFRHTPQVQQEVNFIQGVDVNEGWESLSSKISSPQTRKNNSLKLWKYAAAAVVLLMSTFFLYDHEFKSQYFTDDQPLAYDVMPGSKRAILQLADGAVVNLNHDQKHAEKGDQPEGINVQDGTLYFTSNDNKNSPNRYNALRTPRAGEYKIVLPDGTKVWLNASSYLRFPDHFSGKERRVELKGEAYFEVAHNRTKPFIVSFNDTEVKVLGTKFNVNTYGNNSKTTLVEGSVSINEGGSQQLLKPGQEALVDHGAIEIQEAELYKSIAWKEGVFYFNEDNLKEILDQLSRWYDVEIIYHGKPNEKTFSGNIRRQATLNQVLEMLSTVSNAKFNLKDRVVTVSF
jgi:transmembrane sensor